MIINRHNKCLCKWCVCMVVFNLWPLGPCGMCSRSPMKRTGEGLPHVGGFPDISPWEVFRDLLGINQRKPWGESHACTYHLKEEELFPPHALSAHRLLSITQSGWPWAAYWWHRGLLRWLEGHLWQELLHLYLLFLPCKHTERPVITLTAFM